MFMRQVPVMGIARAALHGQLIRDTVCDGATFVKCPLVSAYLLKLCNSKLVLAEFEKMEAK